MEKYRNLKSLDINYDGRDIQGHIMVPHTTRQDDFNNNHITVNPFDENRMNFVPFSVVVDDDLLNNNMTLTNVGNILSISLTSPTSTTVTTSIKSSEHCFKLCHRTADSKNSTLIEKKIELNAQTNKSPKKISNFQKYEENYSNNKKGKKKKEKPKPLRGPSGGAAGGGGRGRGMSEQEQMMKRPRRKTKKQEK